MLMPQPQIAGWGFFVVTQKTQKSRKDINLTQISQIPQMFYILRILGFKDYLYSKEYRNKGIFLDY